MLRGGGNSPDTSSEPPSPDLLARATPVVRGSGGGTTRVPARIIRTAPVVGGGVGSRPLHGGRDHPAPPGRVGSAAAPRARSASTTRVVPSPSARRAAQGAPSRGRLFSSGGGAAGPARRPSSVGRGPSAAGPRLTSLRDVERARSSAARPALSGSGRRRSEGLPAATRGVLDAAGEGLPVELPTRAVAHRAMIFRRASVPPNQHRPRRGHPPARGIRRSAALAQLRLQPVGVLLPAVQAPSCRTPASPLRCPAGSSTTGSKPPTVRRVPWRPCWASFSPS